MKIHMGYSIGGNNYWSKCEFEVFYGVDLNILLFCKTSGFINAMKDETSRESGRNVHHKAAS
jgi:hypothetical protein